MKLQTNPAPGGRRLWALSDKLDQNKRGMFVSASFELSPESLCGGCELFNSLENCGPARLSGLAGCGLGCVGLVRGMNALPTEK